MRKTIIIKRILVAFGVLLALVWVCLPKNTSLADEAATDTAKGDGIVVVSMGDSYSSGEGNTPFYGQDDPHKETNQDWLAHRSEASWPGRLTFEVDGAEYVLMKCRRTTDQTFDPDKKVSWYFVAASGAETKHINGQQEKEYCFKRYEELDKNGWLRTYETVKNEKDHPALLDPQIDVFNNIPKGAVDYVTLTIGGNDARFGDVVKQWALTPAKSFLLVNELDNLIDNIWNDFYGEYEISEDVAIAKGLDKKSNAEIEKEIDANRDIIYQRLVERYGEKKARKLSTNDFYRYIQIVVLYGEKKDGIKDRLKKAYSDICNAAGPQATLIVVGYPQLFSGDKFLYFFNNDASKKVNNAIKKFNEKIQGIVEECAAEGLKIEFVSVEEKFKNHGAYSDKGKQWLHRIIIVKREEDLDSGKFVNLVSSYSVHPNEAGLVAYAELVQNKIKELEGKRKGTNISSQPTATEVPTFTPTITPTPEPTATGTPTPTFTPTPTSTPTPTFPPTPTFTPTPSPTNTPTPTPSFPETGETIYGDLTQYIGMTAEEVIKKVGKPYQYEYTANQWSDITGELSFDYDVSFDFIDSGPTLDLSCKVYMIEVHLTYEPWLGDDGIKRKNIGSGLGSDIYQEDLEYHKVPDLRVERRTDARDLEQLYEARRGGFQYSFVWGHYGWQKDLGCPAGYITIIKEPDLFGKGGADSPEDLIKRYLDAYSRCDFAAMIDLIWAKDFEAVMDEFGLDYEDCARKLYNIMSSKKENDGMPNDGKVDYKFKIVEERPRVGEDFINYRAVWSFRHALIWPDKIAVFEDVFLSANGKDYNLVGDKIVGVCFGNRWYIPSMYTGLFGLTNVEWQIDELKIK